MLMENNLHLKRRELYTITRKFPGFGRVFTK